MSNPEMMKLNEIAIQVSRMEVGQQSTNKAVSDMATNVTRLVEKLEIGAQP